MTPRMGGIRDHRLEGGHAVGEIGINVVNVLAAFESAHP